MGTWSTSINGNDEFMEVYETFKELYHEHDGKKWLYDLQELDKKLKERFSYAMENPDLAHEFWFAQAKAFWEYGIDDDNAFKKVKKIIQSGANLEVWRSLDAKEKDIAKRKKVLDEFLTKLSRPNSKPYKRKKVVRIPPAFFIGDLIIFRDDKKNHCAAVVTSAYHDTKGSCKVHLLNYYAERKPAREDLLDAALLSIDREPEGYAFHVWSNRRTGNFHGFGVTSKKLKKSLTSFEKIGAVEFHEFGYFIDGLRSWHDMEEYTWDFLPVIAALNYRENQLTNQQAPRLRYYTTDMEIENEQAFQVIHAFKNHEDAILLSQTFKADDLYGKIGGIASDGNISLDLGIKNLNAKNTQLVKNILFRVFGRWLKTNNYIIDDFYSRISDYDDINKEYVDDYKRIDISISEWETKNLKESNKINKN